MPTTTQLQVPDGYYQPFAVISENDHAGWIIIASALGLAMVLITSIIRIFIRLEFGQKFGVDDVLLAAATLLAVIQEAVILGATSVGLGKHISLLVPHELADVERSYYAGNILAIPALGLAKVSLALFILRLTPIRLQKRLVYGIIGATGVWVVLSMFLMALQCDLSHPWALVGEKCSGVFTRVVIVCTLDILLEVAMFSTSVLLVCKLQTAFLNKAIVVIAFGFRLPLIVTIALRMVTFSKSGLTTNFTLAEASYIVWTETQINYSLISATIPILRPFINTLSTNYGIGAATEYSASASGNATVSNAYMMSSLRSDRRKSRQDSIARGQEPGRTFKAETNAFAYSGKAGEASTGDSRLSSRIDKDAESRASNESQRMIIRKDVEWDVQTEDRGAP